MKALFLLAFALLSFPSQAAGPGRRVIRLDFLKGAVHLDCSWAVGPALSPNESKLEVQWVGSDQRPIEAPGSFKAGLYMPGMHHGSSPTQIDRVIDDRGQPVLGAYLVNGMFFTMAGNWEVHVSLQDPDGRAEMQSFRVHMDGAASENLVDSH